MVKLKVRVRKAGERNVEAEHETQQHVRRQVKLSGRNMGIKGF